MDVKKIYRSFTQWGPKPYLESIRIQGKDLPEIVIIDCFPNVFFKRNFDVDEMDFFGVPLVQYHPYNKPENTDPEGLNRQIFAPERFCGYNQLAESIPVKKWQKLRKDIIIAEIAIETQIHEYVLDGGIK